MNFDLFLLNTEELIESLRVEFRAAADWTVLEESI